MKILTSRLMSILTMFVLAVQGATSAYAADILVLSPAAVQGPVRALAEQFERDTGHHLIFDYTTAGGVDAKLKAGGQFDIVMNSRSRLDALAAAGLVAPTPASDLGLVKIGVAMRKGGTRPDLSSVAAFRHSLEMAQSISYGDPAKGPTSGIHAAKMIEKLGLTDALKARTTLVTDGLEMMALITKGQVELGITQVSEINNIQPEALVGLVPEELQLNTIYSVTAGRAAVTAPAQEFIDLLLSPAGRDKFRKAGFQ